MTAHGSDVFVFKLAPDGAHTWTRTYDSGEYDQGLEIASDPDGNVLVTGHVDGATDFGGGIVPAVDHFYDAFVVKAQP